ncbi:MAG TPA: hypothetical protein VLB44_26600 [Kofleriaceae bacterium]|nr:hypothetical protein [Kofleriaceae bacterium]
MKRLILLAAILAACSKSNDVQTLHREAANVADYYQPKLDALDKRVQDIFKRGTTIPANLPGIEEVGKRLTEARDTIVQLRGIVAKGPDGKSAVVKQADLAAKDRKIDDLHKLVEDTEATLERGTRVVEDDLWAVESWIALYDQGINKATAPTPEVAPQPVPELPTPAPGTATPPPAGTGQPPSTPTSNAGAGSAAKAPPAGAGAGAGSAGKAPAAGAGAGAGSAAKAPAAPKAPAAGAGAGSAAKAPAAPKAPAAAGAGSAAKK